MTRRRATRRVAAAVGLATALGLLACAPEFGEEQACALAGEYLLRPQEEEWQHLDFERYPASAYKEVEILECSDYRSKLEEGWARIRIHARGDEYELDGGAFLGRTIFSTEVEFERADGGWRVLDSSRFDRTSDRTGD